jgi:hypothetical protein
MNGHQRQGCRAADAGEKTRREAQRHAKHHQAEGFPL